MRNKINKALAHLKLEIAGGKRDGVFYFVDTDTDTALDAVVYVSAMTHLTIKQWIEEATAARLNDNEKNQSKVKVVRMRSFEYKNARLVMQMSQQDLADALNVSRATIMRRESCEELISTEASLAIFALKQMIGEAS